MAGMRRAQLDSAALPNHTIRTLVSRPLEFNALLSRIVRSVPE